MSYKKKSNLRISVVTATRNSACLLDDCLASIAQQTYPYLEHLIVDGASTDGTINLINRHIDQIATFVSEPDTGIYDALNKGIQLATGDVVGFLHSDDIYASTTVLARVAEAFDDPTICAVYGDLDYVSKHDNELFIRRWKSSPFHAKDLGWGWMPAHPTLYVRKEWYLHIGGFDTNYQISADYHCILKFFMHSNFKASYIPEVFVKMRTGGASNKSFFAILKKTKEDWYVLRSCNFSFLNAVRALAGKNLRKVKQFFIFF